MMLDRDIVAVSPASTYRVLKEAGLMRKWNGKETDSANWPQRRTAEKRHVRPAQSAD